MEPTVGRIVHFFTTYTAQQSNRVGLGPYPAIITRVWSPTVVNLKVLPDCGAPFDATSISELQLTQEGAPSQSLYWCWPPRVGA